MKQKDIGLIAVIVIVSFVVSLVVSNSVFSSSSSRQQTVEKVQRIDSSFPVKPNSVYFNGGFDPSQLIQIAPNNNNNPFPGS